MSQRPSFLPLVAAVAIALSACGGGGGDSASSSNPSTTTGGSGPASGNGPVVAPSTPFAAFGPVSVASNNGPTAPVAARLQAGGSVVVWQAYSGALLAQRLDANGQLAGGQLQVAAAGSNSVRPAIAALRSGGFAVAWSMADSSGRTQSVQVRTFDASGAATSAAVQAGVAASAISQIDAAPLPGGGLAIAWSATPLAGGPERVAVQRFNASGAALAQAQLADPAADQREPRLAVQSDGSLVLGWLQSGPSSALPSYQVNVQRFAADGSMAGPVRALASTAGNVSFDYDLAALSNDTLALAWQSFGTAAGVANLNLQLLAADGTPVSASSQLPGTSGVNVSDPSVAALGATGFVVTWQEVKAASIRELDATISSQRFSNAAVALEQPQQVATYGWQTTTGQATGHSSIDGGSDGHFVLAYDRWQAGSFIDVLGR